MTRLIAASLLALAASSPAFADPLQTIDVLCGGVEPEERERLTQEVRGATIELEFFSGTRGDYVADVDVLFSPIDAPVAAFGIVTTGPVCLLELPPGEYRVHGWFNGHARSTVATIGKAQAKRGLLRVSLGFPVDRGDDPFLVPVLDDRSPERKP